MELILTAGCYHSMHQVQASTWGNAFRWLESETWAAVWDRWGGLRRLESEMGGTGDRVAVSERGSRGKREARSGERKKN